MISQTVVECVAIREKAYHGLLHITFGAPKRGKAMLIHTDTSIVDG